MANTTRPNVSEAWVKKLENYKKARIAEGYTWYELDDIMDKAYTYVLSNEKREKEESERDQVDKEMTNRWLDSKDERVQSEFEKNHRFYMFKKAVTQAYKDITGNYPKKVDDYEFAKQMEDANPESADTIRNYLSWYNVSLKDVMMDLNLENATNKYKTPESDGSIYHQVTSAWREWTEWNDELADTLHLDTVSAYDAGDNFWWEFAKNLWRSVWNIWADTAWMVLNPYDSAKWLKNMIAWWALYVSKALHDLVNWESTMEEFLAKAKPEWWWDLPNQALNAIVDPEEAVQSVDAMKDYFINRYGSVDAIANTLYEDPAGLIRDAKDALRWFSWVAKKTATWTKILNAIDKYSPDAKIENAAIKWLNKTIEWATDITMDDIKNIPANTKAWLKDWAEKSKEYLWQLSKEEQKLIQDNPYAWEQLSKAIEKFEKEWKTKTPEQIYDSMVKEYVTNELVPELEKIIDNVSEEWRAYWDVDKLKLKANNFQNQFETNLKNKNIWIDADWNLDFTKAHTINENSEAINKIYNQIKEISNRWEDITVSEYRDMRKLIWSEMNKAGKWTDTYSLLSNLRDSLNKIAHEQSPELSQLDELFNKNAEKAKELKKWLVDKQWNIKPEALARESKRTGKSVWLSSEDQLEELLPWHKSKMEWLNLTKTMLKKYKNWENIVKWTTVAWTAIWHGVWLLWWWGIWGIVGSAIWWFAGNKLWDYLVKKRGKNWADTLSSMSEEWLNKLKEINDAIEKRWSMTATDKAKVDDIIKSSQATKAIQKVESKAAKTAAKQAQKEATKLEKQKALAQQANERFKANYNKFRWFNENDVLATPATSNSPFANQQFNQWAEINKQFQSKIKKKS